MNQGEEDHETTKKHFHTRRTPYCDRYHRNFGSYAAAGAEQSPRYGQENILHKQYEVNRDGPLHVHRRL